MTMFSGTKAAAAFERKSDEDDDDDDDVEKCDEMKATTTTAFVEEDDSRPSRRHMPDVAVVGKLVFHRPVFTLVLRQVHRSVGKLSRGGRKRKEEEKRIITRAVLSQ